MVRRWRSYARCARGSVRHTASDRGAWHFPCERVQQTHARPSGHLREPATSALMILTIVKFNPLNASSSTAKTSTGPTSRIPRTTSHLSSDDTSLKCRCALETLSCARSYRRADSLYTGARHPSRILPRCALSALLLVPPSHSSANLPRQSPPPLLQFRDAVGAFVSLCEE